MSWFQACKLCAPGDREKETVRVGALGVERQQEAEELKVSDHDAHAKAAEEQRKKHEAEKARIRAEEEAKALAEHEKARAHRAVEERKKAEAEEKKRHEEHTAAADARRKKEEEEQRAKNDKDKAHKEATDRAKVDEFLKKHKFASAKDRKSGCCSASSPLHEAVKTHDPELVKSLVAVGADPKVKIGKKTPLELAQSLAKQKGPHSAAFQAVAHVLQA